MLCYCPIYAKNAISKWFSMRLNNGKIDKQTNTNDLYPVTKQNNNKNEGPATPPAFCCIPTITISDTIGIVVCIVDLSRRSYQLISNLDVSHGNRVGGRTCLDS